MTGTIKWFDEKKGYGFITVEGEPDLYVHSSDVLRKQNGLPRAGDRVEFEVAESKRGPKAARVAIIERAMELEPQSQSANRKAQI